MRIYVNLSLSLSLYVFAFDKMRNPRKDKPRSSFFLFVDTKFCPRTRLWYNKIQEHNRISYKLVSASIPPPFLLLPSAIQDRIPASRNCEAEFREGGNLLTWIENWKSRIGYRRKGFLLINLREVIGRVVIEGVKERKEKGRGKVVGRGNSLCLDAAANAFKGFHKSCTAFYPFHTFFSFSFSSRIV